MRTHIFLAAALATTIGAAAAYAHGEHHSRFDVENKTNVTLKVQVYNGNDFDCVSPHREKYIPAGKTQKVTCHGKGRNRCFVTFKALGFESKCNKNADGKKVECWKNAQDYLSCDT